MNILIVDDEEMVRVVLTEKLAEFGFSSSEACDGESALELFRHAAFDAVLLDLKMPGMNGIETLKGMRSHDPHVPVIMVTAFGDIPTAVEAIKIGAYDFVEKPPQISRIVVTLRRAIEKARLEREVRSLGKSVEESAALKRAYEKLKELDQMKTAFLSSVSHELRTPLTSVIGFAEISRMKLAKLMSQVPEGDPKSAAEMQQVGENLEELITEAGRLKGMINGILDMTSMMAGTTEWKWGPVSVREIIADAAQALSGNFREKGLELTMETEEGLPLVKGDRYGLSQVMSHLLSNAAKFTDQGTVTCTARSVNGEVVVSVADTGRAIPASFQQVIFDMFRQIGEPLTGKPEGIGLGLPICRLIVEQHGGTIGVESEPGRGNVFTVSLPVEREEKG